MYDMVSVKIINRCRFFQRAISEFVSVVQRQSTVTRPGGPSLSPVTRNSDPEKSRIPHSTVIIFCLHPGLHSNPASVLLLFSCRWIVMLYHIISHVTYRYRSSKQLKESFWITAPTGTMISRNGKVIIIQHQLILVGLCIVRIVSWTFLSIILASETLIKPWSQIYFLPPATRLDTRYQIISITHCSRIIIQLMVHLNLLGSQGHIGYKERWSLIISNY